MVFKGITTGLSSAIPIYKADNKNHQNNMERLEKLKQITDKIVNQDKSNYTLRRRQNNIPGAYPNHPVAVFNEDKGASPIAVASIPGYNFIMVSDYREIWILEGVECYLIGIGSPFGRKDYVAYLNTLQEHGVSMLAERMEYYGFVESSDSIMFGINGTLRVLDSNQENLFLIAYPTPDQEVDYEMVSNINDEKLTDTFRTMVEKVVGNKMMAWLHKKFEQHK